jgi:hypothetical protein
MLEYARTSGVSIRVQLIEAELALAALIEVLYMAIWITVCLWRR